MTKTELEQLSEVRLEEAQSLYAVGHYDGCGYLCGYVIEYALKAAICKLLKIPEYPERWKDDFRTHDFDRFKLLAGVTSEIDTTKNPTLFANWSTATKWKSEHRYVLGQYDKVSALEMLDSIRSKPDGVLTWLRNKW